VAQWRFDDEEPGGVGTTEPDVLEGAGPQRSRISRRQLLLGGAGVLAAGTAWELTRPAHRDRVPPPVRRASGPKPLWTFRGDPQAGELPDGRPPAPLYRTEDELIVLDPEHGRPVRRTALAKEAALQLAGATQLLIGGTPASGLRTAAITGYDLATGSTDWRYALPAGSDATPDLRTLQMVACDGTSVYCSTELRGAGAVLAVSLATRELRWRHDQEFYTAGLPIPGGRLLVAADFRLAVIDGRDGSQVWSTELLTTQAGLRVVDERQSYETLSYGGLRARSLADGTVRWTLEPRSGSFERHLRPLATGGRLFLFTDTGRVTCADPAGATPVWEHQLPFLLDSRSRPALIGDTLLVPGPTTGGVVALAADRGTVRWTFQDGEDGVDVWSVAAGSDGRTAHLGHDQVLYAVRVG
jgi:hypothetical protein